MRGTVIHWGLLGISTLLSAFACSGRNLNDVGELNSAGGADHSNSGASTLGAAGASAAAPDAGTGDEAGTPSVSGGGSGGRLEVDGGDAGQGGDNGAAAPLPADGSLVCRTCKTVALAKNIRGAAANNQKVFWIEYGTNDHFGNYNNDGRLLVRDLAGGAISVLADSLPGPEAVALSGQYVYLAADHGVVGPGQFQVLRVPLGGGAVGIVQTPTHDQLYGTYEVFAFAGGSEFWVWGGAVYRLDDASTAAPETFIAESGPMSGVLRISANSTTLYYSSLTTFESSVTTSAEPLVGGASTQVSSSDHIWLADDQFLYGEDGSYLTRMPISGGAWKRVGRGADYHLAVDGDAYFTDRANYARNPIVRRIMQESFSAVSTNVALASELVVDGSYTWQAFAYSPLGVFFADATGLYLVPPATP